MKFLKKITPEFAKRAYHKVRAFLAALWYGFPAHRLIVIGVTGTKGKTSTANYVWSVLRAGGYKVGLISSANFRVGEKEEPNPYHMTMPDPFLIQKKMREMVNQGVTAVAMEFTSEGMKQHRHTGISVDIAIFTNLTPEHLGSHEGSFEVYKEAKSVLFEICLCHLNKIIGKKLIPRVIIANSDSEHAPYYLKFPADEKITYGLNSGDLRAVNIESDISGTNFSVDGELMHLSIPGSFNVYNALPAIIAGRVLGIPSADIARGLAELSVIPGRMELVHEGQDFTVLIDYAHEPASLEAVLGAASSLKDSAGKIILVTGVIGGGRESRKPLVRLAAKMATILVLTNEDPYDEDPNKLLEELTVTAKEAGKEEGKDLFSIIDRREAIEKALSLAQRGDIVIVSGKGAEQTMITKDGAIPWDERAIVKEIVRKHI